MAFERQDNVREYYRRITEVDIGMVARELLGAHVLHESDRLLQCDCPNHSSQSHRSLHVMLDKQGWYCFGCGVGGDVLQLVEFIQSGRVTRGQSGPMPERHPQGRGIADVLICETAGESRKPFLPNPTRSPQVTGIREIHHPQDGARIAERVGTGK